MTPNGAHPLRRLNPVPDLPDGEVPANGPQTFADALITISKQKDHIASLLLKVGKLEAQERREEERKASTPAIKEVLEDWRPLCMPRAKIVANSPRWKKVSDRLKDRDEETGELAYTTTDLKEATRGALLSDFHRDGDYLDAESIFRDQGRVDKHLKRFRNWCLTPQGREWHFDRCQKWLRASESPWGVRMADAWLLEWCERLLLEERRAA